MKDKKIIFIFDLDGTLCDQTHRQHLIHANPDEMTEADWDLFHSCCDNDREHAAACLLFRFLRTSGAYLIQCTGRSIRYRRKTVDWLCNKDLLPDHLMMKRHGDPRPDAEVKREMLQIIRRQHGEPIAVFEDRPSVVKMWREEGVACFACDDKYWRGREC